MARWGGEMEFDFVEDGGSESGSFVATAKVVQFIRNHLARNEIEHAVRLYEQAGAQAAEELLKDATTASLNSQKALADMFVMARDFAQAARIYELGRRWTDAARMFEQSGDFVSAARCFQKDGDPLRTAAALERAGNPAAALEHYLKAGANEAAAECLARQHRFFEAAQLYQKLGNVRGEVEMLRLVPVADPNRMSGVRRLAGLLEQFGHAQHATQLIMDTVRQIPAAQGDGHLMIQLIRLLESLGRTDQAARLRVHVKQLGGAAVETRALPETAGQPPAFTGAVTPMASPPPAAPAYAAPQPAAPAAPTDPFSTLRDPFGGGAQQPQQIPPEMNQQGSSDAYAFLKQIPIFGELTLQDMKDLYRLCQDVSFAPGTTIIEQGVKGRGLTIILDGQVNVVLVQNGQTTQLAQMGPGKYVGEISLVDDVPTSARVVAHTPVRALFLPRERFDHFLYSREAAAMRIYRLFTRTLAERLRAANQRK